MAVAGEVEENEQEVSDNRDEVSVTPETIASDVACCHQSVNAASTKRPFSRFHEPVTTAYSSITVPKAGHPLIMDPTLLTPRALGLIPPGLVSSSDRATVELYFTRHPYELNISPAFVDEMNAHVLAILQQSPQAIVDSLSAIGHSYLTTTSASRASSRLAVLNYRARILATLRAMLDLSDYNLEVMVFMLLGLSAIELVDCQDTAPETTIPAVIANAASLLAHHRSTGRAISPRARYFIRALARQDMIVSLVHRHRPMIPTCVWLDETAQTSADRLMGYTATLMPLLEELCVLAEDIKTLLLQPSPVISQWDDSSSQPYSPAIFPLDTTGGGGRVETSTILNLSSLTIPSTIPPPNVRPEILATYAQRAEDLRLRIESWKPNIAYGLSFRNSRRYLSQAACYRSGALLYLFRLLHPPQLYHHDPSLPLSLSSSSPSPPPASFFSSSTTTPTPTCDGEATAKAHEVLLVAAGPGGAAAAAAAATDGNDEVKMLLWPVFLAACEMSAEEDRQTVLDILDAIMAQRRTVTAQRTKSFVLNRVWPARDEGRVWNWMVLAEEYPGECLPI